MLPIFQLVGQLPSTLIYLRAQESNPSLIHSIAVAVFDSLYHFGHFTDLPTRGSYYIMPYYLRAQDSNTRESYHQLRRPPSPPLITYSLSQTSSHPGQPLCTSHSTCGQDSNTSLIPSVAPVAFSHLLTFYHLTHLPILSGSRLLHRYIPAGSGQQYQPHTLSCAGRLPPLLSQLSPSPTSSHSG